MSVKAIKALRAAVDQLSSRLELYPSELPETAALPAAVYRSFAHKKAQGRYRSTSICSDSFLLTVLSETALEAEKIADRLDALDRLGGIFEGVRVDEIRVHSVSDIGPNPQKLLGKEIEIEVIYDDS